MPVVSLPVPVPEAGRTRSRYRTRLLSEPSDLRSGEELGLRWVTQPAVP